MKPMVVARTDAMAASHRLNLKAVVKLSLSANSRYQRSEACDSA